MVSASIKHISFYSLLFLYFIVWPYEEGVGWWRTALVYILSGTGGTLLSGLLTPYQPMVGTSLIHSHTFLR